MATTYNSAPAFLRLQCFERPAEQFHAEYTLHDGTGSLKIVITIIESVSNLVFTAFPDYFPPET